MLTYSYSKVKEALEPLIKSKLPNTLLSKHRLRIGQIASELIPLNKGKLTWEDLFLEHYPYYYIYGMNKRNWRMVSTQELPKLERIVINIIHRNIDIELLPLDDNRLPISFEDLHIHNYILYYCLLAFSGNWGWLMDERDLIFAKVPGLELLDWKDLYYKYSSMFRLKWKIDLDI